MSEPNITSSQIPQESTANVPTKKKNGTIIVVLIVVAVLVLVLGCAGIFFIVQRLSRDTSDLYFGNGGSDNTESNVVRLDELYVKPDDTNPDYWFDDGAELPYSYSFSSEVLLKQRLLTYSDGYGSEIIAFGGYPELYNFSILKPLYWTRTRMEPDNYELTSPNEESNIGVRLFPKGTRVYAEYTSCRDEVEKIYSASTSDPASISIVTTSNVIVDGKSYERVDYIAEYDDYPKLYGLDQCYKDSTALILVYAVISENDYSEHFQNRVSILDDFIWDKI